MTANEWEEWLKGPAGIIPSVLRIRNLIADLRAAEELVRDYRDVLREGAAAAEAEVERLRQALKLADAEIERLWKGEGQ